MNFSGGSLSGSTIVTYSAQVSSLSTINGTLTLNSPIIFNKKDHLYVRLLKASVTTRLPNIYQTTSPLFNNGLIAISRDGGTSWVQIQLDAGIYEVEHIAEALNAYGTANSWWTDSNDPGISIEYNLATHIVYVELDSTKLAAGGTQLGIDFSLSQIDDVLGFQDAANQTFTTDGSHVADSAAQIDWFGNNISILISGLGALSLRNGNRSEEICSIPLSSSEGSNEYLYPTNGMEMPIIPILQNIEYLRTISFTFLGSRVNASGLQRNIYANDGNVEVQIQLMWGA